MKKRLLSALLALALVFVLLPTTALAGETTGKEDYDISINGKGWKFERDNTSGAYIPVYYYANYSFNTDANDNWATNSNLKLTKEDNTVTITIRPKKKHISGNAIEFTLEKKSTTSGSPYDYTPCIEMGNNNNLVITGKGTLNITRDEKNGIGAALCSEVGDITITDGITVKANFLKQVSNSTVGNAISVKDHNLIISGKNTKVEARNSSCNFQDLYDVSATVCVENGEIKVSDGATLSAINNFTNSYTSQYSYYSRAISGSSSKPCALTVTGENSCVIAETDNSLGKAYGYVNFSIDGAKIEVGTSSPAQTITDINNIKNYKYAKISVPALEKDSYVYIAGGPAVVGVRTSLGEGNGYYTYNKDTKTFTLENVNITSVTNAIQFMADGTYTINLVGTNTISDVSAGIVASNLYGANDITAVLSGTGSLDITAGHYAINMQTVGNLKFENTGTIKLTTGYKYPASTCNALYVVGNVTIDKTKYDIKGEKQAQGFPTEDIGSSPDFKIILKGTSAEEDLYFKSITITPAAAKDSTIRYNGTTLKQGETIRNGGTATVDSKNNTITLKNFNGTAALSFDATLADSTLVLEGTNTLSSIVTTQKGLTISGSGSLTVGSIKVHNQKASSDDKPNLTINGATVTVGTAELTTRAIDIDGNLTVTNGSLTATSKSDSVPTVQVGGNASFTGSTVTITNNSTTQGERYKDSNAASSALHVNGAITISGGTVMAEAKAGGNAIRAVGNITVSNDATVTAKNNSQYFNAITAGSATGGEVNTLYNLIVSGENTRITATNAHDNKLAYGGAINAYIENANEGHYLKANTDSKAIAPNDSTTVKSNDLTITRGDEVTPVVIAGTPLRNDTYYTITNGSTVVANGSKDNYNAFYESATKTLKLNNAQISHSFAYEDGGGQDGAIIFTKSENYFIELSGENTISSTNTYAINCHRPDRTLTIKNAAEAENAKLTLTSNWMVICSIGGLNIQSDVTMVNTKEAGYLMYVNDTFSFDGYNAYASVNASGSPLVEYTVPTSGDKDAGYQYLRITKETLETGGGSTHEHVFSTSWESNADYHWHKCTVQGCTEVSDKEAHVYTNTWWKNSNGNHGRTCDKCRHEGEIHEFRKYYDFADETYHVERCGYLNCTYVGRQETHSYDSFGVCKCGYSPNGLPAPPSLQGVAPTSENGTDGKILNSNIGMEYAQNLNGPWTKWNEHSNITGLSAGTYYVRYTKTDERFPDNQVATVEVPAYTPGGDPTPDIPAAPTGLVGVAPTSENGNGKITGTTAQMEYASSLEGDWTTCANDSTDVPAGKYYVRMKKTDNTPAGEVVEVTVPAYSGTGEITPDPTPDNPGTIVIIRPAEEEKPAQQPNPSTGANDLVGLAVAAAVAAALGSAALLRKHD